MAIPSNPCQAKSKSGQACKATAKMGSRFCWFHDPATEKERAMARKRGGHHSRPTVEIDLPPPESPGELAVLIRRLIVSVVKDKRSPKLLEAIVGASKELSRLKELETKAAHLDLDGNGSELTDFFADIDNS